MHAFKKHISVFLFLVFLWVLLPAPLLHTWFADHRDTADNECELHHSHLGLHVEKKHVRCDIFKTHTPLYDSPHIVRVERTIPVLLAQYLPKAGCAYEHTQLISLPARAPPHA